MGKEQAGEQGLKVEGGGDEREKGHRRKMQRKDRRAAGKAASWAEAGRRVNSSFGDGEMLRGLGTAGASTVESCAEHAVHVLTVLGLFFARFRRDQGRFETKYTCKLTRRQGLT